MYNDINIMSASPSLRNATYTKFIYVSQETMSPIFYFMVLQV